MLREAGDVGPLLAWLYGVEEDLAPLVAADVDVSAQSIEQIGRLAAAAATAERRARVHLKIDTGLSRNGAPSYDWQHVRGGGRGRARRGARGGRHLVAPCRSRRTWPSVDSCTARGVSARVRASQGRRARADLPASGQLGWGPRGTESRLDLVRIGIAAYGIDPAPGIAALAGVALRPVMRLRSQLVNVKQIQAGAGVSYGWTWTAEAPPPSAWCLSATATGYRVTPATGPGWAGREAGCRSAAGSAWTSSSLSWVRNRSPSRARTSSCSALVIAASQLLASGRPGATPSATRS